MGERIVVLQHPLVHALACPVRARFRRWRYHQPFWRQDQTRADARRRPVSDAPDADDAPLRNERPTTTEAAMLEPVLDVWSAAHHHAAVTTGRDIELAAEVTRLRGEVARLREALAAMDQRIDYLQRRSEGRDSRGFKVRKAAS